MAAEAHDAIREGPHGSAWFAHRAAGAVSHVDIRGPAYKGSLSGGRKTLFHLGRAREGFCRPVIAEAPIDALSMAAIEGLAADTLYAATGGGMGPGTIKALTELLAGRSRTPDAIEASATDANAAGDRFAVRHEEMAAAACVRFVRLRPPEGLDWNDVLQRRRRS